MSKCLTREECAGPVKALTKYHLAQILFVSKVSECKAMCQDIVNEFLGEYHILKNRIDRKGRDDEDMHALQYILYYCFLLLAYVCEKENRSEEEGEVYLKAGKNLFRDQNVLSGGELENNKSWKHLRQSANRPSTHLQKNH